MQILDLDKNKVIIIDNPLLNKRLRIVILLIVATIICKFLYLVHIFGSTFKLLLAI